MKRFLLTTPSKVTRFYLQILAVVLLGIGVATPASAQCAGPYQNYESFFKTGASPFTDDLTAKGWTVSTGALTVGSAAAQARSGTSFATFGSTPGGYIQTPLLVYPDKFQFYFKSGSVSNNVTFKVEYSSSISFASPTVFSTITTTSNAYVPAVLNLSALSNVYIRITTVSAAPSAASMIIDDVSWTSRTPSLNTIIVPELGNSTCGSVTPILVPSSGNGSYKFYDQGGVSDAYTKSSTQTLSFGPTTGTEKVKLTFNSLILDALTPATSIAIYDGPGTGSPLFTNFPATNANAATVLAAGALISTHSSGTITVVFTTSTGSVGALNSGFDATVECVGPPTITGLTGSGCAGGTLVITGTNLEAATAVTVGGVAVSAIGANTSTSLTVTPAPGSSGVVKVTTVVDSFTTVATYTVNALPTISSQPSSGTQTICLNGASTALSVTAAAGSGTIQKYEWYSNTTASTTGGTLVATNTTAATTNTYTPLTTTVGTLYYYVVVTNSNGCSVTSAVTGAITINAPVVITASPSTSAQTICVGAPLTALSVTATGGGLSYQWYSNSANSNVGGTSLGVSAQTSTYTPSNASAMATTYYYCVVSNGVPCSSSVTSAVSGAITVNAVPNAVTVATSGTYCASTTLTASIVGGGTIYYQGTTSGGISTTTPATSQLISTLGTGTYYFRAYNGSCWGAEGSATVTIVATPGSVTTTANTGITANSFTANWNAVAGATAYYLDVSTSFSFSSFVGTYSNLNINNVITYTVTGLNPSTTYFYRVRAYNGTCSGPSGSGSATTLGVSYCTPNVPSTSTTYINNFTTTGGITNISNLATGFTTGGYANYTSQSCSQYPSSSVSYSIGSVRSDSSDQTFYYYIWVDWNNDGDFLDAGETMLSSTTYSLSPFIGSFAVPVGQASGSFRMRVSTSWVGSNTSCSVTTRSETEDYRFTVVPVPPCASSTPSALTSSSIFATGATISWTDAAMTPNSVYNYYYSTSPTAPLVGATPSGTVTGGLSANLTGLILGNTYYFWVRSNCGTPTAWVGSANFTTITVDIINMSTGSLSTCNARFYDSGGSAGNYSNSENYTYTVTPSTAGSKLKAVFNSFRLENSYDFLSIYNGTSAIPANLIGRYTNAQIVAGQTFFSTAAGGELTFVFTSDGSVVYFGWDAILSCVTVPVISSFTPTNACTGTTPSVNITGLNFSGVTSVKFNGVAAAFVINSGTSISTTLPAGVTTGLITISNPQATGTSTTLFVINPLPVTPNAGSDVAICSGSSTTLNGATPPVNSVILSETFNSGAWPSGWDRTLNGGYNPGDFRTTLEATSGGNSWPGNGYTGYCSYFYTFLMGSGVTGDMITPIVDLSSFSSTSVSFWIYNSGTGTDVLKVYANNNGGAYTQVGSTYGNYATWTQITINLSAFAGTGFNNVRIKFTGTSDNGSTNIGVDDIVVTGDAVPTVLWSPSTGLSATNILNPVANPTSTATYTLTSSYASGCSTSDTVVVTVNPKPTVTIPTASANICANSVVPVTAGGTASTYTWSSSVANTLFTDATGLTPYVAGSNTTTIYVKTPSDATITTTGTALPGGCFATATVTFTVVIKTYNAPFWTPGGPPVNNGTENLVFNAGNYTSSGDLSACSCSVTGANVTFASGHTLSLVNGLTVSSGSMTFNSGASLVQTNPVANSGSITYKRDSTPCFKNDYTYWSSPVAGQTLIGVSPATGSSGFFDYNASINNWQQTPFASVMSLGKGYLIRVPSSYPVAPALPTNFTANFVGVPNNGTVPVSIVYNAANELNLIGNPYPSAISAMKLVTDPGFNVNGSFVGGTIYLWSHNSNVNYVTGQYDQTDYAVWNVLGGVNTYYTGFVGSGNSNAPSGNIAAGQGFFIKTVASGTAYFRNSMRVVGNNNTLTNFYRTSSPSAALDPSSEYEKHRIWLDVNNGVQAYKQLLVGYVQDGTDGLDRLFDGEMVDNGNTVSLYTTVETKKLTIQGRGLTFAPNDTFALGFKTTVADSYSINLSNFDGLFMNQAIYLEDKLLNVIHDLKDSPYAFSSPVGVFEDRFVLRFTNETLGTTTPVFSENSVVVYKNEEGLFINTGSENMKNVSIYDIRGRLLASQKQVGKSTTVFTNLPRTQQVLLVKIEGENGGIVTKKVVF